MAAVTICSDIGAPQNKVPIVSPSIFHEVMGPDAMILVFWVLSYKPTFSLSYFISQFSSVAQLCPTLCDPMNSSTPGLPVHYQLPESTQTHVHWFSDGIQSLSFPSPPALNLSQHQGLFKWVSSSHQVAKVLEFQLQHQSFQGTPRTDLL